MTISLLHATARPEAAKACQKLWLESADGSTGIEIITCVDHNDAACREAFPDAVLNYGVGVVPAWNEAARHATGDVFVVLDDDWIPPSSWNQIIESYMCNGADILHVGDKHRKDELICHPIISRRFYEAMGYVFHPSFRSVYCDNHITDIAKRWGYVDATEGGKIDLGFVHKNPSQGYGTEDEVARKSNSRERYAHGQAVYRSLQDQTILAFTVAGRRDYLTQTLNSWLATDLSLVTAVHFFIEPIEVDAVNAVIESFADKCPVPIIKHFNKEKLGVLRNPWHLFDHCFRIEGAKFVILGEDDFLVSPDVLNFLCSADKNDTTMAVCAKWVGKGADKNPATWHRTTEFTGNIWGTWKIQWNKYLRDTWDFDYSSGKADDTPSGWDWNIQLRVILKNNLHCIVPTASRSKHIGVTGAHCYEEVFKDTVAWNFLEEPYFGPYREKSAVPPPVQREYTVRKSMTHAGDLGDCVVSLATLHSAGYLTTFYLHNNGQTKGIIEREHIIRPLLERQPYIESVKIYNGESVDWRSEGFRGGWVDRKRNLANCHARHALDMGFIAQMPDTSEPWLFNIEDDSRSHGRVVINRSPRYQNPMFPWKQIAAHYGSKLLFIGLPDEHRDFCNNYGNVEYVTTANMLDAARLIKGAALYIGNQSSCMTLAEGLKHPRIQEGSILIPDCIYPKAFNAQYVFDGAVTLPAIGDSPELKLKSQAISWASFDTSIVPKVGKTHGWCYQYGNVMLQSSSISKVARQLSKMTSRPEKDLIPEIVIFTVRAAPEQFASKVRLSQFGVVKIAMQENGYTSHPLLDLMGGKISDLL